MLPGVGGFWIFLGETRTAGELSCAEHTRSAWAGCFGSGCFENVFEYGSHVGMRLTGMEKFS